MHAAATTEEKLKIVYLCMTTGLPTLADAGIELSYDREQYKAAREAIIARTSEPTACIEDVQTEMLRKGNDLVFTDTESDDEVTLLNLSLIENNWDKVRIKDLAEMDEETGNWDADTACNIMQCLLYGEIVYG
jgi:hypothetical protein